MTGQRGAGDYQRLVKAKPRSREWYAQMCFWAARMEMVACRELRDSLRMGGKEMSPYFKRMYVQAAKFYITSGLMFRLTDIRANEIIVNPSMRPWLAGDK